VGERQRQRERERERERERVSERERERRDMWPKYQDITASDRDGKRYRMTHTPPKQAGVYSEQRFEHIVIACSTEVITGHCIQFINPNPFPTCRVL
jgi:hypothetical protein